MNQEVVLQARAERRSRDVIADATDDGFSFFPNFCRGGYLVNVLVLAELLAIAITVLTRRLSVTIYHDLLLISLFVQWVALVSVVVLCALRPTLNRLAPWRALGVAYLVLLLITVAVGELSLWSLAAVGTIPSPRPHWYLYFHVQNLIVSAVVSALALRYFLARHQLRQKTLSEASARAELRRHRVRRHFLFHAMGSIAALTRRAPAKAEAAVEDMADLFRLMLDESRQLIPVSKEIDLVRKYVNLEKLRLQRRLKVAWSIRVVPRHAKTPVLLLQLLVENAINTGIEPRAEGGEIAVSVDATDDGIAYRVAGPAPKTEGPSEILGYVRARLDEHFARRGRLEIEQSDEREVVRVWHPATAEDS